MGTASMGQPGDCQPTSGLPQHAECCHVQHQWHTPLSRVGAETQLSGCALVQCQCSSGVIPSSPHCMHTAWSRVQHPTTCTASHHLPAGWHLLGSLQVGSETPTPCRELRHLPHVGHTSCCGLVVWDVYLIFSLPLFCAVKMQIKCCHSVHSFCNANAVCSLCTCCFPD